jgi:hypothetical protein
MTKHAYSCGRGYTDQGLMSSPSAKSRPFDQLFMARSTTSLILSFSATLCLFTCIRPASADILPIFNTGVDGSGIPLSSPGEPDPHWLISGYDTLTAIDWYGGWMPNKISGSALSGWIGPDPNKVTVNPGGGTYTYIQNFTIPNGATNLSLSGSWAVDDEGKLFLNGYEIVSARYDTGTNYQQFKSFILDDPSKLLPGSNNTLKAVIVDYGGPTGFQAQFQGTFTPVPGPIPALGVAAALASSRRLRRRIRCQ